jgi:hypothetical protein
MINPGNGFGGGATSWTSMQVFPYSPPLTQQDLAFRLSGSRNVMFEAGIQMSYIARPAGYSVRGKIQVRELSGPVVPGAEVWAQWVSPGGVSYWPTGYANNQGVASFKWNLNEAGLYTFCVYAIIKSNFTYNAAYNWETCDTIMVP